MSLTMDRLYEVAKDYSRIKKEVRAGRRPKSDLTVFSKSATAGGFDKYVVKHALRKLGLEPPSVESEKETQHVQKFLKSIEEEPTFTF